MQTVTVRHGKVFGERWKAQVSAFALDTEATSYKGATRGLHLMLKQNSRLPALTSNGYDDSMGVWYGAQYAMEEGRFIMLKAQHDFMKVPHSLSAIMIRLRPTGPMLMIKGIFPTIHGFQHANDLVLFQGRGDIIEQEELEDLDLWDLIHPWDRSRSFEDPSQVDECFDIIESTRVPNYQEKPELMAMDGVVGAITVPKPQARRLRINKPKGGRKPPTRKRRRRRS